ELTVHYLVEKVSLSVTYSIRNKDDKDMYFSVGAHPAFAVPLVDGTTYTDYFLDFGKNLTLARWPISSDGLMEKKSILFLTDKRRLSLCKELFYEDALVFKNPATTRISLASHATEHGLALDFPGFPYLGIWAARNADFVCIEPWCGIADPIDSNGILHEKEGINRLAPGGLFERNWKIDLF
ncbi:MAG TPA: hypothetical protein VKR32_17770, partial [Puia sp.]|nr:hypothetical protein [Puia sp.]